MATDLQPEVTQKKRTVVCLLSNVTPALCEELLVTLRPFNFGPSIPVIWQRLITLNSSTGPGRCLVFLGQPWRGAGACGHRWLVCFVCLVCLAWCGFCALCGLCAAGCGSESAVAIGSPGGRAVCSACLGCVGEAAGHGRKVSAPERGSSAYGQSALRAPDPA